MLKIFPCILSTLTTKKFVQSISKSTAFFSTCIYLPNSIHLQNRTVYNHQRKIQRGLNVSSIDQIRHQSTPITQFNPQKVLILTKLSRFDFEKLRNPTLDEKQLEITLKKRGADYSTLLYHHYIHKSCEARVLECFQSFGVETRIVNRFEYIQENVEWADVIITTGGDGTFLMAACRIQDRKKPVIGFNTDPTRSEGHLCLPKKYSVNIRDAVRKLFEGKFSWTFRKRIRITLIGENVFEPPIELHDQQLQHPEYRFFDCMQEQHNTVTKQDMLENPQRRVLPALALNEVYFGECVSARVSYFEVSINNGEKIKTKNAGICVSTGTGSTSWSYNISKINPKTVETICDILNQQEGIDFQSILSKSIVERVTSKYNTNLIFKSEVNKMLYTIRDPISTYTLPYALEIPPRGFANRMEIRSRCFDACLAIDGGLSYKFNDGTLALLEVHHSDALRTVSDVYPSDE